MRQKRRGGLEPYEDPKDGGNAERWHTGRECALEGCSRPAGTAWSPFWCFEHSRDRVERIRRELGELGEGL